MERTGKKNERKEKKGRMKWRAPCHHCISGADFWIVPAASCRACARLGVAAGNMPGARGAAGNMPGAGGAAGRVTRV